MSNNDDVDGLLNASLSTAFTPVSLSNSTVDITPNNEIRPKSPAQHFHYSHFSHQFESPPTPPPADPVSREDIEKWQKEQEAQLAAWREENARARKKAEDERARWEALRAEDRSKRGVVAESEASWGPPSVLFPETMGRPQGYPGEPSVVDARDRVAGEPAGHGHAHAHAHEEDVDHLAQSTPSSSHKWEEIPSDAAMESSYPSLSYPSHSRTPSPSPPTGQTRHHEHHHRHQEHQESLKHHRHDDEKHRTHTSRRHEHDSHGDAPASKQPALTSPTLAIFSTPSSKTRLAAIASSLAINLLLPFINGVMLGFGEIVARGLVVKLGWGASFTRFAQRGGSDAKETKRPGGSATAVGLSGSR